LQTLSAQFAAMNLKCLVIPIGANMPARTAQLCRAFAIIRSTCTASTNGRKIKVNSTPMVSMKLHAPIAENRGMKPAPKFETRTEY
jgi:hypothetical protein